MLPIPAMRIRALMDWPPVIWESSSGTGSLLRWTPRHFGTLLEPHEKSSDLLPDGASPGQPAPVLANQSNQFVAGIDRGDKIVARLAHAIDEPCLHVALDQGQSRIPLDQRR